jgi:hypothetical protein
VPWGNNIDNLLDIQDILILLGRAVGGVKVTAVVVAIVKIISGFLLAWRLGGLSGSTL